MRRIFAVIFVLIFVMFTVCYSRPYDEHDDTPRIIMEFVEIQFKQPGAGRNSMMEVDGPPPRE